MRFTRLVAGLTTAGLLGLAPVAISSPAGATENLTTTVTIEQNYGDPVVEYGTEVSFIGSVVASNGDSVYEGTVTLYRLTPADPTWVPMATVESGGYISFENFKPQTNAAYKAVYSGATAVDAYHDNYAASETAPYAVNVFRKLSIKNPRGTFIKGKVAPKYKKKKIVILKKVGKKYKKFRTLRTNKKSRFSTTLPASRRRTFFRITVPGDKNFVTAVQEGSTISYRSTAGRLSVG